MNKLIDQNDNTYHHFINKKPINANSSALTKKLEMNSKVSKVKVNGRARITKFKNSFCSGYTEN